MEITMRRNGGRDKLCTTCESFEKDIGKKYRIQGKPIMIHIISTHIFFLQRHEEVLKKGYYEITFLQEIYFSSDTCLQKKLI